jgi:hypothetical protein
MTKKLDTTIDTEFNALGDGDATTLTPARLAKQRREVQERGGFPCLDVLLSLVKPGEIFVIAAKPK